jgi:hypothetical protein
MFDSDVIVFRVISGTYENWMGKLRRRSPNPSKRPVRRVDKATVQMVRPWGAHERVALRRG